jgi:hypothetical protein
MPAWAVAAAVGKAGPTPLRAPTLLRSPALAGPSRAAAVGGPARGTGCSGGPSPGCSSLTAPSSRERARSGGDRSGRLAASGGRDATMWT